MHSLTVRNASVVTEEDILMRGMIVGCPQAGPGIKPCMKAVTILLGKTFNLITDRERPLEECFRALSDGVPPGMIYALPMVHPVFGPNPPTRKMKPCGEPQDPPSPPHADVPAECSGAFSLAATLGLPWISPW
jgi:hypothetical protein